MADNNYRFVAKTDKEKRIWKDFRVKCGIRKYKGALFDLMEEFNKR